MTINQQEEQLREEWKDAFYGIGVETFPNGEPNYGVTGDNVADWWLAKLTHQLTELGKEITKAIPEKKYLHTVVEKGSQEDLKDTWREGFNFCRRELLALLSQRGIKID